MTHKHEEQIPVALESVLARLGELEVVLGRQVAPTLAAVRERRARVSAWLARSLAVLVYGSTTGDWNSGAGSTSRAFLRANSSSSSPSNRGNAPCSRAKAA